MDSCQDKCVEGQYCDTTTNTCANCKVTYCSICNGPEQTCQKCLNRHYQDGQECISCSISSRKQCICGQAKNCVTCNDLGDSCEECMLGFDKKNITDSSCDICADGFIMVKDKCQRCAAGCDTCSSIDKCDSCKPGFEMTINQVCQKKCTGNIVYNETCLNGKYQECGDINQVVQCNCQYAINCLICDPQTYLCGQCLPGYQLKKSKCEKCEPEAFSLDKYCFSKCADKHCANCSSDNSQCEDCKDNYQLIMGSCTKCAHKNDTLCTCGTMINCAQCDPITGKKCYDCLIGYKKSSLGNCDDCANGYNKITQDDTFTCNKCSVENCHQCAANSDVCTKCESRYYLTGNTCTLCTVNNTQDCTCQNTPHCATCAAFNISRCDTCVKGYKHDLAGECSNCADGYCKRISTDQTTCTPCTDTNCAIFDVDKNHCTKCMNNFSLTSTNTCQTCAAGSAQNCSCGFSKNCELCAPATPSTCGSCLKGYKANARGSCVDCDAGFAMDTSKKCTECTVEHCQDCSTDITECSNCRDSFQLRSNVCQPCSETDNESCNCGISINCSTCDSTDISKCNICQTGYKLDDEKNCSICQTGYQMLNGICTYSCKLAITNGQFCAQEVPTSCGDISQTVECKCGDLANCYKCENSSCSACLGNYNLDAGNCDSCAAGFVKKEGNCVQEDAVSLSAGGIAGVVIAVLLVIGGLCVGGFFLARRCVGKRNLGNAEPLKIDNTVW
ncbi:Cysteine-rich membrane protein 2 [Spironucleus salmonicida]|uniref:Cysteine-rich membrane protein 2 n=1 Tax=Spironucleus salmonicida TaxID=348837 RepID=V6LTY5_9EUKA|nr:Cysteine-rich membrane protein 2 [Spironucleus salmonicida]|eukprot:EST44239.1 Cysteine-rich membrane protein 2 [Spironucleus salmonicida]